MPQRKAPRTIETHGEAPPPSDKQPAHVPIVRAGPRVGRNDPCPCGSGKKYKKCHMAADEGGAAVE